MMSYQSEREEFLVKIAAEGLPIYQARKVLAMANRLQVIAELSCSSEWHNNVDRVKCPADPARKFGKGECLCDQYDCKCGHSPRSHGVETIGACADCTCVKFEAGHDTVPRIDVQEARIKRQLTALLAPYTGIAPDFQGDPRGAVVKLKVPSGNTDDWGRTSLCVPAKGLPASFWERNR